MQNLFFACVNQEMSVKTGNIILNKCFTLLSEKITLFLTLSLVQYLMVPTPKQSLMFSNYTKFLYVIQYKNMFAQLNLYVKVNNLQR